MPDQPQTSAFPKLLWEHGLLAPGTAALGLILSSTGGAYAQGYCSAVTGTGLNLGCAETLANTATGTLGAVDVFLDPVIGTFDGLIWDSDTMSRLSIGGFRTRESIAFSRSIYRSWQNVFIGSARTDGGKTALDAFAFGDGATTANVTATLLFDRLTLENTTLTLRDGVSPNGRQTGQLSNLSLGLFGSGGFGQGGGLTLRNSDLVFRDSTRLLMSSPNNDPVFIRAASGTNELRLGSSNIISVPMHVDVSDGARLDFVGTTLEPFFDSWLSVGRGAELRLRANSVLGLTKSNGSAIPSSEINGGTLRLEGAGTELQLTDPRITDGSVILDTGATFRVQDSNNAASSLTFSGNSNLRFESGAASMTGSVTGPNELTVNVGAGTTVVSSSTLMDVGAGLRARNIAIDQGALDISGLRPQTDFYGNFTALSLRNGGTFFDAGSPSYAGLKNLDIDGGTLRSQATFGSFGDPNNLMTANLNNATIDVFDVSPPSSGISPGLTGMQLNADQLQFSGDNQVRVGISPSGECFVLGGSCVPGTTRFSGRLVTNIAGSARSLTGFGTVLVVPFANDQNAGPADYVSGGVNGIYTVAVNNSGIGLPGTAAAYDATPRTPTATDLAAAGSTLPANLLYTIVNDPVADGQVDIAFTDVGLKNHPNLTPTYRPQFTNSVVVQPATNNTHATTVAVLPDPKGQAPVTWTVVDPTTNNLSTITQTAVIDPATGNTVQQITTVVTQPNGATVANNTVTAPLNGKGAVQLVTTTITNPNGAHVTTTSVAVPLNPATGTTNTANFGQLVTNTGGSLPHRGTGQVSTLHPEAYASFMTVALEQSDLRRNMVLSNANGRATGDGRIDGVTGEGRNVWFDAGLTRGSVEAEGGLAGFDYDLNQIIFGTDIWADERRRMGAYFGYGTYAMDEHTASADTLDFSSDAFSVGAYGVIDTSNWAVSGMAGMSWGNTDATRDAVTGTGRNRHQADYDHRTFELAVRAEYTALPSRNGWQVAPEIGLGYAYYEQDGFAENSDPATALAIDGATAESLIGSIGVNLTGPAFGGGLIPLGFIRYERDFLAASDDTHDVDAAFATSPGLSQSFVGTHRGENAISLGLGLGTVVNASVDASAGVVYQKNSNGDEFGGGVRVTWQF